MFDATEGLQNLIRNGSGSDRTNGKRRARDVFSILNKQFTSGIGPIRKSRARPKLLLGHLQQQLLIFQQDL